MFEDKYKAANDMLHPSAEAEAKVLEAIREEAPEKPVRSIKKSLTAVIAAALCVLFVAPAVIGITKLAASRGGNGETSGGVKPADNGVLAISLPSGVSAGAADDYSSVFSKLSGHLVPYKSTTTGFWEDFYYTIGGLLNLGFNSKDAEAHAAVEDSPESGSAVWNSANPGDNNVPDHSDTNVQVAGVDEADVVKTDGRYIYVLSHDGVTILEAAGEATEKISFIPMEDMPKHQNDANVDLCEMYIADGKLIVIGNEVVYGEYLYDLPEGLDKDSDDCLCYGGAMLSRSCLATVYVYDVSDAADPVFVSAVCQDGFYNDSRLINGKLCVVTDYTPCGLVFENVPATYVPCTYNSDGECKLTPCGDIHIEDNGSEMASYVYVSTLDIASPDDFSGTLAILGCVDVIYCSGENLYVTCPRYEDEQSEIDFSIDDDGNIVYGKSEDSTTGTLYISAVYTDIYRVSINGARPVLEAKGSIEGYLLNQFSLDEYNGNLRAAVHRDTYSYIVVHYSDESPDDGGYWYENDVASARTNAVVVLDSGLNTIGKLEGLGDDELIKSCRFMGDTAYVVTFRQTDPLFSIDLSDPTSPKVLGELKIPGFSEYLHPWGDGMLLGLGQKADMYTGGTEGIKLSMFDVSDKSDVKELFCKSVDGVNYSPAEYDHKAILAAPERGLICFPADWDSYVIYTFDETNGFVKKGEVKATFDDDAWWSGEDMRGMYIGDYFYVIGREVGRLYVIDLNSFMIAGTVNFK